MHIRLSALTVLCLAGLPVAVAGPGLDTPAEFAGVSAFGDWSRDRPGARHRIRMEDLPPAFATKSSAHMPRIVPRPAGVLPKVPTGFTVALYAEGLNGPRTLRTAPNGDIFVAETEADRISVLRAAGGSGTPTGRAVFASGLNAPFGIAFYPPGPDPRWVYVANTDSVVRFAYRAGDMTAPAAPETVIAHLPSGGHSTRDIAFDRTGTRMFVSVGSASNVGEGMSAKSPEVAAAWDAGQHVKGSAWGDETNRAAVLVADPLGAGLRIYAAGIRNCVGLAVEPVSDAPWCSVNERDGLGDDLVPDYVTRVNDGAWYGWPWFYIGDHEDPRQKGRRPDLAGKATVPDVLLQPHSASLGLAFGRGLPGFGGDAFAGEHGSWNRLRPTGYKVIRVPIVNGAATGGYEDFMTGFVIDDDHVWGRPVGVTFTRDGALLVSEDAGGTIWRATVMGER